MKKRNFIFSSLFCLLIVFIGAYVMFIKSPTTLLSMELRKAKTFIGPSVQNVKEGFFQDTFEKAFSDQFIKREWILKLNNLIDYNLYKYSIIDRKPYTLVKIGDNVYQYEASDDYLTSWPLLYSKELEKNIINFAQSVNKQADKYNNINFYVYKPFRINESNWFDEDNGFHSYGVEYTELLKKSLNENVIYASNEIDNIEEYKENYYKTDPHWDVYGSYDGYLKMVEMFNVNYPDMNPISILSKGVLEGFKFYGSYGRSSTYLTSNDVFEYMTYDLEPYKTYVNGNETKYGLMDEYLNNSVDPFLWNYVYSNFYGNDESEVIFEKNNKNTNRCLLAFIDSYSSPIKHLIAGNFDKVYYIDPRINKGFDFESYLTEHSDITDVMYFAFYGSLYNDDSYVFEVE